MAKRNFQNKGDDKRDFKGRRPNSKGGHRGQVNSDRMEGAVVDERKGREMNNDPNWYFTNPEIAKQAAELSFQSFLGTPGTIGKYTMPTIMTIHLNPSPGNTYPGAQWAQGQRSGFNMSMTKLYNRLSMKSGRNMAYAPQDVGAAVLGVGELLSMVSFLRRLFGVAKWWNVRNRMVPKQVIKAMGINPDDFFKYYSNYRMRVNTLIMACNQIPIMTNCGYLRKCISLYDNIYVDCDTGMAQLYMYVPYSTWVLDETSDSRGTVCATTPVCGALLGAHAVTPITLDNWLTNILEPMVSKLLTSSTLNLVYADILNLNKTEDLALASMDIIAEEYAVVPVHDVMALKQIHNMVAMGGPAPHAETATYTKANDVVPDPNNNCIKYSPLFVAARTYGTVDPTQELGDLRIIDTDTSDPDITEKIEITRYTCTHTNSRVVVSSTSYSIWDPVPDHYVVCFIVYTDQIADANAYCFTSDFEGNSDIPAVVKAQLSQFDWCPIVYHYNTSGSVCYTDWLSSDLNSFTIIAGRYIQRLNTIIYMDLFDFRS